MTVCYVIHRVSKDRTNYQELMMLFSDDENNTIHTRDYAPELNSSIALLFRMTFQAHTLISSMRVRITEYPISNLEAVLPTSQCIIK